MLKFIYIPFFSWQRRVAGLHQITVVGSSDIVDIWEPLEEGLLPYVPEYINSYCVTHNSVNFYLGGIYSIAGWNKLVTCP